jgi:hypothetical protein
MPKKKNGNVRCNGKSLLLRKQVGVRFPDLQAYLFYQRQKFYWIRFAAAQFESASAVRIRKWARDYPVNRTPAGVLFQNSADVKLRIRISLIFYVFRKLVLLH